MITQFTITGDVISKKNSKQIIYVRGRPLIIPSNQHKRWYKQAFPQLRNQRTVRGQITALEMIFYPSSLRKGDLDNKVASILDLLVDAQIIPDDSWHVVPQLTLRYGGKDKLNPRCEITIYETP